MAISKTHVRRENKKCAVQIDFRQLECNRHQSPLSVGKGGGASVEAELSTEHRTVQGTVGEPGVFANVVFLNMHFNVFNLTNQVLLGQIGCFFLCFMFALYLCVNKYNDHFLPFALLATADPYCCTSRY